MPHESRLDLVLFITLYRIVPISVLMLLLIAGPMVIYYTLVVTKPLPPHFSLGVGTTLWGLVVLAIVVTIVIWLRKKKSQNLNNAQFRTTDPFANFEPLSLRRLDEQIENLSHDGPAVRIPNRFIPLRNISRPLNLEHAEADPGDHPGTEPSTPFDRHFRLRKPPLPKRNWNFKGLTIRIPDPDPDECLPQVISRPFNLRYADPDPNIYSHPGAQSPRCETGDHPDAQPPHHETEQQLIPRRTRHVHWFDPPGFSERAHHAFPVSPYPWSLTANGSLRDGFYPTALYGGLSFLRGQMAQLAAEAGPNSSRPGNIMLEAGRSNSQAGSRFVRVNSQDSLTDSSATLVNQEMPEPQLRRVRGYDPLRSEQNVDGFEDVDLELGLDITDAGEGPSRRE